ncbi:MAG TPA: choice-of-anchor D domain-containing protein, partial [Bryobacteraceae bacterium]|nr:choice-of-anchor D domain-containing protein [Bryobacteraceae bacterium]
LVLDPGTVTVAGTGGADVGSFTATLSPPAAIAWTNRGQIAGVDQTQGVTVSWSGAAPSSQVVAIAGVSTDKTAGLTGMFLCTAPAGTGSFTVPEQIVANLPSTRPGGTDTAGVLMVGEATSVAPVKFVAQSLDAGYGVFNYFSAKTVDYTQGALPSSAPAISLTSSSVDFSTVIVGQPKNLTVNVSNSGNAPLTVNSLSLSNPLFTVPGLTAPFTLAPGAQQVLTIQFAPTAAGSQIATLTIASNDPVKPSVTISLTGTGVTNPNSPTPIITIVTPPAVTAGGPSFTLTVTGTGFVQQSVVQWNGVNKPTTYDSSTQLHATLSASDIASVTVGSVAVVNPPPGGGTSNSLTVRVNATGSGLTITQFDFSSCPMINAYLTIADRNGNGVPGLSNISVKCTEDGAPVFCDVSSASASGIPLDLALIIDTSANTVNGGIAIERTVADELVSQLGPDTSIELIQAGTTAAVAQNFTPDKPTVTALINTLPTGTAGAALYDAVDTAIKAVQSQRGTHRNAVVIVTQDDNGAGAIQNSSTVLNEAIGASVPIYSITISPGSTIPSLVTFLNQLALNSFGTFYPDTPGVSPQFTMDQIASILNSTYLVSYTTQTPNVPHTLGINNGYSAGTGVTSRSFQGCAAH